MSFSASYDRTTKIISSIVCLGLLTVIVTVHSLVFDCLSLLVIAIGVAYSPRGYLIEGQSILVKRLAGPARVALDGVLEARNAAPEDMRRCIRLWGSGGLFGYYGLFSTAKLGKSTWYVTNRSHAIVVISNDRTVLFSPDDTDGFLAAIHAVAPQAASESSGSSLPRRRFSRRFSMISVIGAIGIAAIIGMGIAANFYSPGPPSYTLTPDALTIHDRFYPVTLQARDVDVAGVRIVDLSHNSKWRPVKRTNGFANLYYESGWFEVAGHQKVRLYRAGGSRAVLLPPSGVGGSPVLYQVADPEVFLAQLRATWSSPARQRLNAGK
jgi:hypothetical protein